VAGFGISDVETFGFATQVSYFCFLTFMDLCIAVWISRNNQQDATLRKNPLFQRSLKAQHVSSGTPLIIRSSKLYLQPLVYMHVVTGRCQVWVANGSLINFSLRL